MQTINEEEVKRFNELPKEVRMAGTEYYGYLAAMHKGVKLTADSIIRVKQLAAIVDEHKITPMCFEADLFKDN